MKRCKCLKCVVVPPGVCPVLCSGHGRYIHGSCRCEPGWKGAECNVATTDCELADCNGRGKCTDGLCVCNVGYKGPFCEQGNFQSTNSLDPFCIQLERLKK
ncbi:teneurin-2 [Caerostris extrusa]|uniref:Teneurin-2 n=1 Tax=Caerostris extrusa TaxID=172846 RepID=A0AAV4N1X5_CAEEX|nr:teneurin-2 [Caerostris extrusa]